jgi:CHAT domain-containing protein
MLAALAGLLVAGCAPVVSVEQAREITTRFQGQAFTPPPRTITDLLRTLDEIKPDDTALAHRRATADAAPPAGAGAADLADFYFQRAGAAARIGRGEQHLDDLRLAARLGEQARLPFQVFRLILRQLAFAEVDAGRFNDGLVALSRAMAIQPGGSLASSEIAARLYVMVGDLRSARRFVQTAAKESHHRSDDFPALWRFPIGKVWVLHGEGRWVEAEKEIREALRRMDARDEREPPVTTGQRLDVARVLAGNLLEQRRLAEAEVVARDSLRRVLELEGKAHPSTARTLGLLSSILAAQGRLEDAEELARVGVTILEGLQLPPGSLALAEAHHRLGRRLVARRNWSDAAEVFRRAHTAVANAPDLYARIFGRDLDEPLTLALTGRAAEAVPTLLAALAHRRQNLPANHPATAETQGVLAVARKRAGDAPAALADFRAAVPALVARAAGAEAREHRVQVIVEEYLDLLSRTGGAQVAAETLRLAENTQGRGVQRALAAAATRAAAREPKLADLVRREQDARQQIAVLDARLADLASAPADQQPAEVIQQIRADVEQLRSAHEALRRELARGFPDYASLTDPRPPALDEIQRRLRPDEALVVVHAGAERTLVWAVPARGSVAFAVVDISAARIAEQVRELRRALDASPRKLGEVPPFDVALAHRLYAALLQPVESAWSGAASLIVVPHGALAQLPFALLVTTPHELAPERDGAPLFAPYRDVPWLARRVAVTQLPSTASLVTLRALPKTTAARQPFAGFGDPWFGARQATLAELRARPLAGGDTPAEPADTRGLDLLRRSAPQTRGAERADLSQLPPLPDTADEVRRVADVLGASPEHDVFLGRRANEEAVRTMDLSNRRVVMFATHGLVPGDLDGLTEPALALTAPEVAGVPGDGLLTMSKILGLRLNADWVVLSACNTAAGEGAGAEAVSGLGRAFFYSGTRAVLVSNWPVETTSAAALTTDLFRRQAETPRPTRAEALRQAMLGLVDGPGFVRGGRSAFSYAHPLFWAPFSLVGDGGGE